MINVIGLGYIGLPTALMLAASGNEVVGTDYNKKIVEDLCYSRLTFEENGLDELFLKAKPFFKMCLIFLIVDIYCLLCDRFYRL